MRIFSRLFSVILLLAGVGCGTGNAPRYAAVSGKVTVDGEPMAGIVVTFEPLTTETSAGQRPASAGVTDAKGRYVLKGGGDQFNGALIGKHRVKLVRNEPEMTDETDPNFNVRAEMKKLKAFKQFPKRYNANTELTLEVPAGGTDKADFDVTWK